MARLTDRAVATDSLLLVHENPSAGIHQAALINAIRVAHRWSERALDPPRILGPTFSGSSESLAYAIKRASNSESWCERKIRIVSGSATDPTNKRRIEGGNSLVTFHATTIPDDVLLRSLVKYIDRSRLPMAVLFEANTQYGRQIFDSLNGDERRPRLDAAFRPEHVIYLPFPMNISRLRTTVQSDQPTVAATVGLPSMFRPLQMEENQKALP